MSVLIRLLEEAAEGLHLLSDKLPPPGKALLDVLVLGSTEQSPPVKDLLPLLGALKQLSHWHAAKISVVTRHTTGWQKVASYLSAGLVEPADLLNCIDDRELWRGGLVVKEKKVSGGKKKNPAGGLSFFLHAPFTPTDHRLQSEVFHYYAPVLDLVQLVNLSDLPSFLMSTSQFELSLSGKSMKAKLLLDQLKSLRGKVGALFSMSCIITQIAQHAASQLSSQRWRESVAGRPKSLPVPDVEVKGESAHYLLLVQGSHDVGSEACMVRMLHSGSQINGAAAMATISGLLRETSQSSSGDAVSSIFPLPCLQGAGLLRREKKVTRVQTLVVKEYLRRKEAASASNSIPVNDLKVIVGLARKHYLKMIDSTLPSAATCLTDVQESTAAKNSRTHKKPTQLSDWPERSVLHNIENLQRRRQKRRFGLLGPGSSDSLLGPKDSQKSSTALLDAKELLKHFTSDGMPTGDLQLLTINRGENVFQLSPDLSPGRISQMPFNKASVSHYHGIEFCLDNQRSLDRDQAFVKLQSRLIRHETQTTCSKEPCALPFALSPAPSPAVMSEPGSVPDGETLENADVARLKRYGTFPTFMLQEVVAKALKHHGITAEHPCFKACSKRLFDISKFYLKDLKTSRGLHEEMKKAASSNVKQVIDWVLEKTSKN
uniref:MDM2 binding protein n=1 Tax=Gasterosteus aculeatus aculeatus TaxID=481459 RepID=A0AAQ4NYF4_GASAC